MDIAQNGAQSQGERGRLSSSLASQAAAAAMRQKSPPIEPIAPETRFPFVRRKSTKSLHAAHSPPILTQTPVQRRASYAPAVSSPLNPDSETTSLKSSNSVSSAGSRRESNNSTKRVSSPSGNGRLMAPMVPQPGGRSSEVRGTSRSHAPWLGDRPQRQISLNELGQDYSRYPTYKPPSYSDSAPLQSRTLNGTHGSRPFSNAGTLLPRPNSSLNHGHEGADPEKIFSPFLDDRINAPSPYAGMHFPLFFNEKEADDYLHDPSITVDPGVTWRDFCNKRGLKSIVAGILVTFGLLGLFVVLPVLTYTGITTNGTFYDSKKHSPAHDPNLKVTDKKYPLLNNMRKGLIDPTTPQSAMTKKGVDGDDFQLVFSDEFNDTGRSFYPGDDPYWEAADLNYALVIFISKRELYRRHTLT